MQYNYIHENGIAFCKVDISDLDDLTNLKNESWFGTHRISFVNKTNQNNWLEALNREDIQTPKNLVMIASVPDHVVFPTRVDDGHYKKIGVFKILSIDWQSRIASVGWDIYKPFRGKKLGKKLVKAGVDFCFEVLSLHRLEADILANNCTSQRCATEAGFEQEGCKRKSILRKGKYIDNLIFGIIAE